MPREHADIKMTPEELRGFLSSDTRLILATIDDDDRPWADAVAYRFIDDRVYFRVPTKSRSYQHIVSDGRVCCVVESKPTGSSYYAIKGAMMHGTAEELSPGEDPEVHAQLLETADPVTGGRNEESAIYSVGLDDSTSFVFDKIRYRYQDRSL
jgi:nitroimidazol reductase NimA-like FMN-containing flavoprotein (pyridoxamine 5'-phosphate oxidase superfamily)